MNEQKLEQLFDELEKLQAEGVRPEDAPEHLRSELQALQFMDAHREEVSQPGELFTQQILKKTKRKPKTQWWIGLAVVAAAFLFYVFQPQPKAEAEFFMDPEFFAQLERNETKESVREYLVQTELLLLSIKDPVQHCDPNEVSLRTEKEHVERLLLTQKALSPHMDQLAFFTMQELFQQIETILVDLNTLEPCSDPLELEILNEFIQQQKILTKLRLISQEIAV